MSAQEHLQSALDAERRGFEALLRGEDARAELLRARDAYLASYAEAGAGSWGRLLGALKLALIAGESSEEVARRALEEVRDAATAPASYLRALAQLALSREPQPASLQAMIAAGDAFERVGRALAALAGRDGDAYAAAVGEILADFEARERFLGAEVADTVLALERLAEARGMALRPQSRLLPR